MPNVIERSKTAYTVFEIKALYDAFLKETSKLGKWIDSSEMNAEDTVKAILK